jgi:hypothetical protein
LLTLVKLFSDVRTKSKRAITAGIIDELIRPSSCAKKCFLFIDVPVPRTRLGNECSNWGLFIFLVSLHDSMASTWML